MHAGENLKGLLAQMKYSVARFVAATGGSIPQPRIESWLKNKDKKSNPKSKDTKIICDFFNISSETLHDRKLTEEEIKSIVASRGLSKGHSAPTSDVNEVAYLKKENSLLQALLNEKERIIQLLSHDKFVKKNGEGKRG